MKLRQSFVKELVSGLVFQGAETMREPRKVTKRADSMRMTLWVAENKASLNGKTFKQVKAALHEKFNGEIITNVAVEELIKVCGLEVRGTSLRGTTKASYTRDRVRFVAAMVLRMNAAFKEHVGVPALTEHEAKLLNELRCGKTPHEGIDEVLK